MKKLLACVCISLIASTASAASSDNSDFEIVQTTDIDPDYYKQFNAPTDTLAQDPYFKRIETPTSWELYRSAYRDHWQAAQGDLQKLPSVELNRQDHHGSNTYIVAAYAGQLSNIVFLEKQSRVEIPHIQDPCAVAEPKKSESSPRDFMYSFNKYGHDALCAAAYRGHTAVVKYLLNDPERITLLVKPREAAEYLPNDQERTTSLAKPRKKGIWTSPLIEACRGKASNPLLVEEHEQKQLGIISLLLTNTTLASTLDTPHSVEHRTALGIAVTNNYLTIVKRLIEAGSTVNKSYGPKDLTALDHAVDAKNRAAAVVLLKHKADISAFAGGLLEKKEYEEFRTELREQLLGTPTARLLRAVEY